MKNTRKLILISILGALGSIIGLFESMIPLPFIAPGLRLGLSNIVVLVSIVIFGLKEGIGVSLLKSVLLLLLSGNVSSFMFSFSGALVSSIAMSISYKYGKNIFSLIGISLIGSAAHNTGQVAMASIVLKNFYMFSYLPILLLIGIFTGIFVGYSSELIIENINKNSRFKEYRD